MMSRYSIVAKRYAKALYALASEQQQSEVVEQHLQTFVQLLQTNEQLASFIHNPNVASHSKAELIKQLLGSDLPTSLYNTIRLLLDRDRNWIFPDLFHAYVSVANEALGRAEAIVYTPYALSEAEQKQIAKTFGKLSGKQIKVKAYIDESLLGGMTVRIGDRLYDGSFSGKLQRMEEQLKSSQAM